MNCTALFLQPSFQKFALGIESGWPSSEWHCCLFSLTLQNRDARIRFPDAASLSLRDQFEFQAEVIHFAGQRGVARLGTN